MSVERNLANTAIRERYGLEGMVTCGSCGRAVWPSSDFYAVNVTFKRDEDGNAKGATITETAPELCETCKAAQPARKK